MNTCIKDLYDEESFERCFKCGTISLKRSFDKRSKPKDGFYPQCIFCRKKNNWMIEIKF